MRLHSWEEIASNRSMRNRQWYWGLALTAALAVTMPAGAQQKQQAPDQQQAQQKPTKAGTKKPAKFDPCTGSGLPATDQMAPFAPGSPSNIDPATPKKYTGKVTCSDGKCKAEGTTPNNPYAKQSTNPHAGPSLPLSPGATKAGKKNTAKAKNAFPVAKSEAAEKQAGQVNAPQPSSAEANPFPEAQSQAAQSERQKEEDAPPAQQGAYSSSSQRMPGVNAMGNGPMETRGGLGQPPSHDPALGKKDDKVGHFYLQRHDWAGAYGRYKEATEVNRADIQAVIGLAIAADHLGKRETAIRNYKLYLAVLPDGPHSKEALKALKRLEKK